MTKERRLISKVCLFIKKMTLQIFLTVILKKNSGGKGWGALHFAAFKKDMLYVGDAILIALCWYKMQYFHTAIGVFQGSTWWKQVAAAVLLEKETFIATVWLLATKRRTQWVYEHFLWEIMTRMIWLALKFSQSRRAFGLFYNLTIYLVRQFMKREQILFFSFSL